MDDSNLQFNDDEVHCMYVHELIERAVINMFYNLGGGGACGDLQWEDCSGCTAWVNYISDRLSCSTLHKINVYGASHGLPALLDITRNVILKNTMPLRMTSCCVRADIVSHSASDSVKEFAKECMRRKINIIEETFACKKV